MEWLLETAGDPVWIVGIFLVLLVVFHLLLIWLIPLSAKQWKLIDYIWVSLTFISSLGLVDEARRYKAEMQIVPAAKQLELDSQAMENWFENYREFACEERAGDPDSDELCRWVSRKQSDLQLILADDEQPVSLPTAFIDEVANVQLLSQQERQLAATLLRAYQDSRNTLASSTRASQRSFWRQLLVVFAPLLFAAALALKMTKVTGEYRLS